MIYSKNINGVVYQAEYRGKLFFDEIVEHCKSENGKIINGMMSDILFNEVLISPQVSADDFHNIKEFNSVYQFLYSVASGDITLNKSKGKLKNSIKKEWAYWRLVYCDMANFTYDYVFNHMTPKEVLKANYALDMVEAEIKKQSRRKR